MAAAAGDINRLLQVAPGQRKVVGEFQAQITDQFLALAQVVFGCGRVVNRLPRSNKAVAAAVLNKQVHRALVPNIGMINRRIFGIGPGGAGGTCILGALEEVGEPITVGIVGQGVAPCAGRLLRGVGQVPAAHVHFAVHVDNIGYFLDIEYAVTIAVFIVRIGAIKEFVAVGDKVGVAIGI